MSYRNYIGKLPKKVYEETKGLTEDQLVKKYCDPTKNLDYFEPYDKLGVSEVFCFGKYGNNPKGTDRFFKHKLDHETDTEFSIASKDVLLEMIEYYRIKVYEWYGELVTDEDKNIINKCNGDYSKLPKETVSRLLRLFGETSMLKDIWSNIFGLTPYNLDMDKDEIVSSSYMEYSIFELVRILKTFDWENDVLVYYGH